MIDVAGTTKETMTTLTDDEPRGDSTKDDDTLDNHDGVASRVGSGWSDATDDPNRYCFH